MERKKRIRTVVIVRVVLAFSLVAMGVLLGITGIQMWLGSGGERLREFHFYLSMVTTVMALSHIALSWKFIRGYFRYLTRTGRSKGNDD